MPNSHLKFHSVNGKRKILLVEDEFINQEMLRFMLEDIRFIRRRMAEA